MFYRLISIKLSIHKLIAIFLQREISVARITYGLCHNNNVYFAYCKTSLQLRSTQGKGTFNFLSILFL